MAKNRFGDEEETPYDLANKDREGNALPVYMMKPEGAGDVGPQLQNIPAGAMENLVQSGESIAEMGRGAYNTIRHPYETFVEGKKGIVKGLADAGSAQDMLRLKVVDALKRGDYGSAATSALYYMIPMLGPQLAEQGEMFARGEWGRGLGHTLATAGQMVAPEMLKGTQIPLSPRFQVKSQLNPAEQANQAFLESEGVDSSLAMQTGSRTAAGLQGSVRQSVGGSQYAQDRVAATQQQLADLAQRKAEDVYPGSVSPEQAGAGVRGALQSGLVSEQVNVSQRAHPQPVTPQEVGTNIRGTLESNLAAEQAGLAQRTHPAVTTPEMAGKSVMARFESEIGRFKQAAKRAYNAAWKAVEDPLNTKLVDKEVRGPNGWEVVTDAEGNPVQQRMALPVNMRGLKDALKPIIQRYERTMPPTQRGMSLGLSTMRDIVNGPDWKTVIEAEADLGLLKDAARSETGLHELRTQSQGMAAHTLGQLQADIDGALAAAHGGQEALAELQAGRANTAQQWGLYDLAKDTFGKKDLSQIEPVQVHGRLTWGKDAGIEGLRKVAAVAPDQMPQVGRAFIDSGGNWANLGAETKRILFRDPRLISDLDAYYAKQSRLGPLTKLEPVALFDRLVRGREATVEMLRDVAREAPGEMRKAGRAFIDAGGDWEKLGADNKKILFRDPRLISDLDAFYAKQGRLGPLAELEPVALFDKLTRDRNATIEMLRDVQREAPTKMPQVGRAFLEELLNRVFREGDLKHTQEALNAWDALGHESKLIMFRNADVVNDLDQTMFAMKRLAQEVNPSGSGYMVELNTMKRALTTALGAAAGIGTGGGGGAVLGAALGGTVGTMGVNAALARLLFNPKYSDILRKGIQLQLKGDKVGAASLIGMLSKAAKEPPPKTERPPLHLFLK